MRTTAITPCHLLVVLLFTLASPPPVMSQEAPEPAAPPAAPAESYLAVFDELRGMAPLQGMAAHVDSLVIRRDEATFVLESGMLQLATPVNGRTVAAVFQGRGRFVLTPPTEIEREQLRRFTDDTGVDEEIKGLFLLFADSTLRELESQLTFEPAPYEANLRGVIEDAFEYFGDDEGRYVDPDLMRPLLNNESNELFYAHVQLRSGGPLVFWVNPFQVETVSLSRKARSGLKTAETVCQFRDRSTVNLPLPARERFGDVTVRHYAIDVHLPRSTFGDVSFVGDATLELTAERAAGPWAPFWLYHELEADSAQFGDGSPAQVFTEEHNPVLWVRLREPLQARDVDTLRLFYHGDLVERFGDFFLIKSSAAWYPRPMEGRSYATFDLTFHTPRNYILASVGAMEDSRNEDNWTVSHWSTVSPIRNASFNFGIFDEFEVQEEDAPSVTVLFSEKGHRELARRIDYPGVPGNVKDEVGGDIAKSLRFFTRMFGPTAVDRFFATEILGFHGEAFPGLVHLAAPTFASTSRGGEDEMFRAHEVAHQWWGIGVDIATYHDQWLSEGLAEFSGLWYVQTVREDNRRYFDRLKDWRDDLLEQRWGEGEREAAPIWMGRRAANSERPEGYDLVVYRKSAWVIHMLRVLMLDLRTVNEDAFTAMLRDFYESFQGRRASTEDFRRVVERHIGTRMDWFFDQWVYGTAIPTYKVSWTTELAEGNRYRMRLKVRQEHVPDDFRMFVPIAVDFGQNRQARLRVEVAGPESEIDLPLFPIEPQGLDFNVLDGVLAEVKMERWRD